MTFWEKIRAIIGRREDERPPVSKKRLSRRFSNDDLNDVYDKNNGYCWHCDKKLSFNNYGKGRAKGAWEVDHSIPLSRGGTDSFRNWVPSCISCNRSKGDLKTNEFN